MIVRNENISGSEFNDVCMEGTRFTNINLGKSRFDNINLSDSTFHNINFSDVQFTAAQLGGTVFKHIGPPPRKDGSQERQRPVTFEEAMLCDSVFRKVDLSNVQIIDCNIEGMKIDGVLVTDLLDAHRRAKGV